MTAGATAITEVQALLRVLATGRDVAEFGAAYGETAALLAETARSVVTVERDPERATVARDRRRGLAHVELLEGDVYEQRPAAGRSASSSRTAAVPSTGMRSSRLPSQAG